MTSVRAVPLPKSWKAKGGTCRWCGLPIRHAKTRAVLRRRRWHQACVEDYKFCRSPWDATVLHKSGHRCAACKKNLRAFQHEPPTINGAMLSRWAGQDWGPRYANAPHQLDVVDGVFSPVCFEPIYGRFVGRKYRYRETQDAAGAYCRVQSCIPLFHRDHIVPLWKVDRTLPWPKLIRYWMIDNVSALCIPCHQEKTAKEAVERAAIRRAHAAGTDAQSL